MSKTPDNILDHFYRVPLSGKSGNSKATGSQGILV
jgi:hypothetical protein